MKGSWEVFVYSQFGTSCLVYFIMSILRQVFLISGCTLNSDFLFIFFLMVTTLYTSCLLPVHFLSTCSSLSVVCLLQNIFVQFTQCLLMHLLRTYTVSELLLVNNKYCVENFTQLSSFQLLSLWVSLNLLDYIYYRGFTTCRL